MASADARPIPDAPPVTMTAEVGLMVVLFVVEFSVSGRVVRGR